MKKFKIRAPTWATGVAMLLIVVATFGLVFSMFRSVGDGSGGGSSGGTSSGGNTVVVPPGNDDNDELPGEEPSDNPGEDPDVPGNEFIDGSDDFWNAFRYDDAVILDVDYSSLGLDSNNFALNGDGYSSGSWKHCHEEGLYNIIVRDPSYNVVTTDDRGIVMSSQWWSGITVENYIHTGVGMNLALDDFNYIMLEFYLDTDASYYGSNGSCIIPDFRSVTGSNASDFNIKFWSDGMSCGESYMNHDGEPVRVNIFISSDGRAVVYLNGEYFCSAENIYKNSAVNFNGFKIVSYSEDGSYNCDLIILDDVKIYDYTGNDASEDLLETVFSER